MGRLGQEQEMNETPDIEHPNPNAESAPVRSQFAVRRLPEFVLRGLDFLVAAIFIYAGVLKILDPVQFARDIDNYKMLTWPVAVGLGFYLPWLEIFCGLALIFRRTYRGSILILVSLTIAFIAASIAAKTRGLDISCGCFGHISQGWSFGRHMALDLAILIALLILSFGAKTTANSASPSMVSPHL